VEASPDPVSCAVLDDCDELHEPFWSTYTALTLHVPCDRPVLVMLANIEDPCVLGYIEESTISPALIIHVDHELEDEAQAEVLIHEWAHGLVWDVSRSINDAHGPFWGLAYARAYKASR
jgi:hypothetical protein